MTTQEIYEGLKSLGYPVAYSHFAEGDVPETPFITYYYPGTDNFSADGVVYQGINELDIELYSEKKDLEAEQAIADWLTSKGLFFEKQEYYIESERWIQVVFETSLLEMNRR